MSVLVCPVTVSTKNFGHAIDMTRENSPSDTSLSQPTQHHHPSSDFRSRWCQRIIIDHITLEHHDFVIGVTRSAVPRSRTMVLARVLIVCENLDGMSCTSSPSRVYV